MPTRACFNACAYCGFRQPIDPAAPLAGALDEATAARRLAVQPQAVEVLLLSGELPPQSPQRPAWLARLLALSRLALAQGRLPHTNAGPLAPAEMAALGRLNPSLGLMLEGLGPAYDVLHRHAPSKRLDVRIGQLEQAGRLGIPFTTGLLLGVGESRAERRQALELIALIQQQWGHIQEVILQPFHPPNQPSDQPPAPLAAGLQAELLDSIAEARRILPPEIHLQLPPNLWPLERLGEALEAGIDDLGGIDHSDVINPAHPQPDPAVLAEQLERAGWRLEPRLCVHDAWIPWLPPALRRAAEACRQRLSGAHQRQGNDC